MIDEGEFCVIGQGTADCRRTNIWLLPLGHYPNVLQVG
jgi:hypothetical protein